VEEKAPMKRSFYDFWHLKAFSRLAFFHFVPRSGVNFPDLLCRDIPKAA
jgi:hypothetical protein